MMSKRLLLIFVSAVLVFGGFSTAPQAAAADPVSWAILAPFAIRMADRMSPYVERGFVTGLKGLVRVMFDVVEVLKLPVGLLGCTVGAPFGFFGTGCRWVADGAIAPFKLGFHALLLPLTFMGADLL